MPVCKMYTSVYHPSCPSAAKNTYKYIYIRPRVLVPLSPSILKLAYAHTRTHAHTHTHAHTIPAHTKQEQQQHTQMELELQVETQHQLLILQRGTHRRCQGWGSSCKVTNGCWRSETCFQKVCKHCCPCKWGSSFNACTNPQHYYYV